MDGNYRRVGCFIVVNCCPLPPRKQSLELPGQRVHVAEDEVSSSTKVSICSQ
jgi:hypothetical protein